MKQRSRKMRASNSSRPTPPEAPLPQRCFSNMRTICASSGTSISSSPNNSASPARNSVYPRCVRPRISGRRKGRSAKCLRRSLLCMRYAASCRPFAMAPLGEKAAALVARKPKEAARAARGCTGARKSARETARRSVRGPLAPPSRTPLAGTGNRSNARPRGRGRRSSEALLALRDVLHGGQGVVARLAVLGVREPRGLPQHGPRALVVGPVGLEGRGARGEVPERR
mmetsp:Transcript_55914/g.166326  ORF Transcript_55914/g.166326 Transcript_55914/m.166326 type:complete len:227 (-) Transcript_55914:77-757(-)